MLEATPSLKEPSGRRLGEVLARDLVACAPGTSVRRAAELMAAADTGSIVVLDGQGAACGILTDSDLRRRVVAAGLPSETPVEAVMSSPLVTVPPSTMFFEAVGLMLERHIHHLIVADPSADSGHGGRALGVVADSDLVAVANVGPLLMARRIGRAASLEQLVEARAAFPQMVQLLLDSGVGAYDLARITAETTDRLVRRALELAEAELGPPPLAFCWLGLGSEGRREQTLHTDQDHALVYADPAAELAEPAGAYFLKLAEWVTDALVRCGIPRCKGEVMASNPRWNRPLSAWRQHFANWIHRPEPEALLNAEIFFDLRPIAGEVSLATVLQDQICQQAPHGRRFLTWLADQAHLERPPLGFFRHLVVERSGEHRGELNLKRGGLAPIVNLSRLHALAHGVRQTNTIERLQVLAKAGVLPADAAADLIAAYEFILLLRVRGHLAQIAAERPTTNYVEPRTLSRADRTLLKEYFAAIAEAQQALQSEFSTYLMR